MIDTQTALKNYATKNAWGNPHVDNHFLIKPNLLTSASGTRGSFSLPDFTYPVPSTSKTYIVYGFGGLNPDFLGLFGYNQSWRSLQEIAIAEDIMMNAFINHRSLVMKGVHVLVIDNSYILFAVEKETNKKILKDGTDLYVRFYSNSFFATSDGNNQIGIRMDGIKITDLNDASAFISAFNRTNYEDGGNLYWYHNGYLTNKPKMGYLELGDSLQYVWDTSGQGYFDVPISDLTTFSSTLDNRAKYLILTPEYFENVFTFYDDIEIYVCGYDINKRMKGMFYDRTKPSDLRQVGYCDWSLDVSRINAFINDQNGIVVNTDTFIRVMMRSNSGGDIQVGDGQYLRDLYSIDYASRDNIMSGSVATLPFWRAAELEESSFINWVGAKNTELTAENVKGVFNHFGAMQALQVPVKENVYWDMPELAKEGGLIIEFDINGDLYSHKIFTTESYNHDKGANVEDIILLCGTEVTTGSEMDLSSSLTNDEVTVFDQERFFYNTESNEYEVAVLGTDFSYDEDSNVVNWLGKYSVVDRRKRQSNIFLQRNVNVTLEDIGKPIHMFEDETVPVTEIAFSSVYVWINNKRGVRNIDYVVDGFKIYVTNRHYLNLTLDSFGKEIPNEIYIVASGLPSDDVAPGYGFIVDNMVNHNKAVDVVRNRNLSLFIQGQVKDIDSVYLAEDYHGDDKIIITDSKIRNWSANDDYDGGSLVTYNSSLYIAPPQGVSGAISFENDDFIRLWLSNPYYEKDKDEYLYFFMVNGVLKYKQVSLKGVESDEYDFLDVSLNVVYELKVGLPIGSDYANGSIYSFSKLPNVVSRLQNADYTEGLVKANTDTESIGDFFSLLATQKETDFVVINKQYRVISTMMVAIVYALETGLLKPTRSNMSDAAIDIMLTDYTYLLEFDPVYGDGDYFEYIICFAHGQRSAVGLPALYLTFLDRVNELYFNNRISISRDFHIT